MKLIKKVKNNKFFKRFKFLFKSIFIILSERIKYIKHKNYNTFIINISERLSNENIFYLKIIQALSNNSNILTPEIESHFEKYTDNVEFKEEDLDLDCINDILNINQLKDSEQLIIDKTPIKSGIISIVFKGKLGNKDVIIKIKRKNILETTISCIDNIGFLIKIINIIPFFKNLNIYNIFNENKESLLEQINFLNEVDNLKLFSDKFKNVNYVVIPNVYELYTNYNPNAIVMDYIEGNHINKVIDSDKEEYSIKFSKFGLSCILFNGIFHGDLHPGNVLFIKNIKDTENNNNENHKNDNIKIVNDLKIGIIDYGIVGKINETERENLSGFFYSIYEKNYIDSTRNILELLTEPKDYYNSLNENIKQKIINEISDLVNNIMLINKTITPKDVVNINIILNKYKLQLSKTFCKIEMSLAIADSITRALTLDKSYMDYFDIALEDMLLNEQIS